RAPIPPAGAGSPAGGVVRLPVRSALEHPCPDGFRGGPHPPPPGDPDRPGCLGPGGPLPLRPVVVASEVGWSACVLPPIRRRPRLHGGGIRDLRGRRCAAGRLDR